MSHLTDHCTCWPVHCSAWLQRVKHTEWDTCPGGGGGRVWCLTYRDTDHRGDQHSKVTVYDDVFTGSASTRRRHELTWAGAWWPRLVSRYTDSFSQRTHTAAGGWTRILTGTHAGSRIGTSASCYRASYASAVLGGVILSVRLSHACFVTNPKNRPVIFLYHTKGQSF